MKQHLKFILLATLMFNFCMLSTAQNTADYPDNATGPGLENVRVGYKTANSINSGDGQNTFVGAFAGGGVSGQFGNSNLGYRAGDEHEGKYNIFVGYNAGISGSSSVSTHIGYESGSGSFGDSNIFLGPKAGAGRGNVNGQLYIASDSGTPLMYGDFADDRVGINTEDPLGTLDVRGASIFLADPGLTAANFPFNRATAIGQSGGPGSTSPLCDLYGFRAQNNIGNSVNVGMNGNNPTILWDNQGSDILTFSRRTNFNGAACQARILRLGDNIGGTYEFDLNGDGRVSASWLVLSDRRIKSDIKSIGNALELITQLNGVTYNYNQEANPELNLPDGRVYGFVAQDVKKVIPEVTSTSTEDGLVGIKYTEIIPLLTQGIKEQQVIIEQQDELILEQETKITSLEDRLAKIEAALGLVDNVSKREANPTKASAFQGVKLSQNRPNPFGDVTTIEYEIPANTANATLEVFNMNGKLMSTYDLQGGGTGTVEIQSTTLQSGTYVYAINIDGAKVATNIMVIQK